jgi:hypothetical protein
MGRVVFIRTLRMLKLESYGNLKLRKSLRSGSRGARPTEYTREGDFEEGKKSGVRAEYGSSSCNPSYSVSGDQEKASLDKKFMRLHLNQ